MYKSAGHLWEKKKQKKNKQDRKKVKVKKGEADKILITLQ